MTYHDNAQSIYVDGPGFNIAVNNLSVPDSAPSTPSRGLSQKEE